MSAFASEIRNAKTGLTEHEGNAAEEGVHGVQSPCYQLLQERSGDSDPVVLARHQPCPGKNLCRRTKSQFVAVDRETPLARKGNGMISGG